MTDLKKILAAIEARAERATPGPWDVFIIASPAGTSSRIFAAGDIDIAHIPKDWNGDGSNAEFIAHMRQDCDRLMRLCLALEKKCEALNLFGYGPTREEAQFIREELVADDDAIAAIAKEIEGGA